VSGVGSCEVQRVWSVLEHNKSSQLLRRRWYVCMCVCTVCGLT
jgi:hypothetical protein